MHEADPDHNQGQMEDQYNNVQKGNNVYNQAEQKPEHPPVNYTVGEVYMIRKQSITYGNDLVRRRLLRSFHNYAKMKSQGREKELFRQYDYDSSQIRKSFRRVHELFKQGSKSEEIAIEKRDKMKARVEKIERDLKRDEIMMARNVDISKLYIRSGHAGTTVAQKPAQHKP